MPNKIEIKKIFRALALFGCVCIGLLTILSLAKWLYYLYLICELTGPICNFVLCLTLGLTFSFEAFIEYSKDVFYERKKELFPILFGGVMLLVAIIIFFAFVFTSQWLNFCVILSLEVYGIFMIELPRLLKAKERIDIAKIK